MQQSTQYTNKTPMTYGRLQPKIVLNQVNSDFGSRNEQRRDFIHDLNSAGGPRENKFRKNALAEKSILSGELSFKQAKLPVIANQINQEDPTRFIQKNKRQSLQKIH